MVARAALAPRQLATSAVALCGAVVALCGTLAAAAASGTLQRLSAASGLCSPSASRQGSKANLGQPQSVVGRAAVQLEVLPLLWGRLDGDSKRNLRAACEGLRGLADRLVWALGVSVDCEDAEVALAAFPALSSLVLASGRRGGNAVGLAVGLLERHLPGLSKLQALSVQGLSGPLAPLLKLVPTQLGTVRALLLAEVQLIAADLGLLAPGEGGGQLERLVLHGVAIEGAESLGTDAMRCARGERGR
jgi:hypothetical protein